MTIPTYDALIVLANEMACDGVLNKESAARADLAADITAKFNIPYIVTCGWAYRSDSVIVIADAFKDYLQQVRGVGQESIIVEPRSRDTVGDAVFTRLNIAVEMKLRTICVVTSSYHVERAGEIFRFVYGDDFLINVEGADVEFDERVIAREASSLNAFRDTFAGIETGAIDEIVLRLRERHPFYNGEVYEKI